ncbi:hypothetical protein EJO66_26390 [Variovorax beijingensis]|uniref:Conjugal transfer protein n=2 Tax=Variovorax beijingensis TaxID=2496117 RepID=A0ABY0A0J2_9BURK|nr:hypothetical protein EJO66_26390 [Variovorax beijingensis]
MQRMNNQSEMRDTAEYVPFEEFRQGLPQGRFRVIVNPALAVAFVSHRTYALPLAIALIGPGIALALAGHPWIGGPLVAGGILLRWSVKTRAPRILLHLATRVPSVYEQATAHGVMEVRRADPAALR